MAAMVAAVADVAPATVPHAAMTAANPVRVPTDNALHRDRVAHPKANARRRAKAVVVHRATCLNNAARTTPQRLLAPPAASATPVACVPHHQVANLTPCAPA